MGRPIRTDEAGDYHHVINRGRNRQDIFREDADRHRFLEPLRTAVERGFVEVHSFTLLDNHYHVLLRSLIDGGTSRSMQLLGAYTVTFNRKYGYDGSLFKGRFYSKRIDSEGYLMEVPRYIANNPVKAGLSRTARDYVWSSHAQLVGDGTGLDFPVSTGLVDEFFSGDVQALDRFVRARDSQESVRFDQVIEANVSEQSLERSLELVAAGLAKFDKMPLRHPLLRPAQDAMTHSVCTSLQVHPAAIAFPSDELERTAKSLLLTLLYRCELADLAALSSAFGYAKKSGALRAIRRFERAAAVDHTLSGLLRSGMALHELAA